MMGLELCFISLSKDYIVNCFIKLLQMLIGPPCGKHIILSILFFAFFLWGNAHIQLPGLWFVIVGVILLLSIRIQFYYYFYHLILPKKHILYAWCTLVVAVPLLLMSMFIYELLFGSEVNDISRWKQRWPVKATVLPEHFRNPDIVPKGLHSISSRGTIESFYDFTTTIVFEGSPEDVRAFEHLVAESSALGLIITPELFKNRVYSYEANSIFLKGDIQSTYDFLTEDYTKWNLFVWLLYGRQLAGGYYQLERVPTYGYTVYVLHRESGIDPYVIYFLFSPDRTRVVFYDFIVTH